MKTRMLLFLLMLNCHFMFSQVIKFSNGVLISTTTNQKKTFMNESVASYTASIGVEYLEHKYFYLSSEIGYVQLGGKESDAYIDAVHASVCEKWNYLQLNTTFRVKYPINHTHFYLGLGPKLDMLLDSQRFKSSFLADLPGLNRATVGAKTEVGVAYDFSKVRIGLNYSYSFNFMPVARGLYNHNHAVMLSIGYRL